LSEAMENDSDYRPFRSDWVMVVGAILLVPAVILGLFGLSLALNDPCSGVSGCEPLVDTRSIGCDLVGTALLIGVPGVWMAHWGSRRPDDD
jgi:hypothetical protein